MRTAQDITDVHHSPQPDSAGWTVITPRARRGKRPQSNSSTQHSTQRPLHQSPRPVEEIDADYRKTRARWEQSECCLVLRRAIAANANSHVTISRAICLGVGTFDPPDGAWEAKRRTFVQLIAFLFITEEIEKHTSRKISCVFQEPIFTESDKAFISGLGHRVVDTPEGCDMVDSNCLIFGVHLYRPVYALALKDVCPAIFIGTGWDVWDQIIVSETDNDLKNMERMEQRYTKTHFPQDTSSTAFSSTCIYWRPLLYNQIEESGMS